MAQEELNKLVARLLAQQQEMEALSTITDDQLDLVFNAEDPREEGPFTLRRLIHRISTHHKDHLSHLLKARRGLGSPRSETSRALAEMLAVRAEVMASLIGLGDEDLDKPWQEGEWSVRQILEHLMEMTNMRLGHIRETLARVKGS